VQHVQHLRKGLDHSDRDTRGGISNGALIGSGSSGGRESSWWNVASIRFNRQYGGPHELHALVIAITNRSDRAVMRWTPP